MARIEWDDSFKTGMDDIDEQHRRWIDIINQLHDVMMSKGGVQKVTDKTLSEMIDYTGFHFTYEEDLMKKINYPEYKKHCYMHQFFRDRILDKLNEERSGGLVLNREVMSMLTEWLREHILNEDSRIGQFQASK